VAVAILVGIVLPVGLIAAGRALGGSASQGWGAVPRLPRLLTLSLGAVVAFCLVPFVVALGGLPRGYTVLEMLLFAALLGAAALYVARSASRGWE
jgi:hypothetical protein